MSSSNLFDVIILGAGAAGMMCAMEAGKRGRSVLLLDHADRPGKKILISGGGRCNFTNLHAAPENFLSQNPHFAKSALARFTPADMIGLVEKHRIPYHEKTLGQLFCDHSAQQIVSMLQQECGAAGVRTSFQTTVTSITRSDTFLVETTRGTFRSRALVIATGGLSIPKMGASSFGYDIARQFGLRIVPCRPGLVPLVFGEPERSSWCDLAGVSAEVIATASDHPRRPLFREKLLITHRGLSGPAILQISSFWYPGATLAIDLAPGLDVTGALRAQPSSRNMPSLTAALRSVLSTRLAERWIALNPPGGWTNAALDQMERSLHSWKVTPGGTEGYAKAEVTAGGVDTADLSAKTMEARNVPGLFSIGEVVDVTGWLGGYNFQWAWASGVAAGSAV